MVDKFYRIFSGIWLGTIVFFSFVIAPQIFKLLPHADAANIQNHLFPFYYIVGSLCGLTLFILDFFRSRKKIFVIALALALAVAGFTVLTPLIHDAFVTGSESMKWLHPFAIVLNVIMLIAVLIAV